ncbi:H-2 class II histocompatibility antigen, E-S beta chain-like [Hyperolius riggenbachi]|uniref:H-2 class II histocompatibility antigen, E-S beta chain-like n=1 Tax=Hyperolius riggenbachi TaxID=752182 RepID=UPI0035A3A0C1
MDRQCMFLKAVLFLLLLLPEITQYSIVTADYVLEMKAECHYMNGTQRVRLLERWFYNQEETVYYDSDEGRYIANTELGRPDAEYWNSQPDLIAQRKAQVQTFCVYSYGVSETAGVIGRRVQPKVSVSLMAQHEDPHIEHHMVLCDVYGFYPSKVEVKWYRNGQEVTAQAQSTELLQNGDWTFQILVMLETEMQKGDTFTCEVHHSSLETPIRVDWHPETSDSAKHKLTTGIVGFVLGTVLIIAGVFVYMRGRKVQMLLRGPQSESFIHT